MCSVGNIEDAEPIYTSAQPEADNSPGLRSVLVGEQNFVPQISV